MISWQAFTILLQTCFFCGQPSPRPHGTSGWLLLLPHPLSWSIGDQSSASPESTKIMRYFFGLRKILYLLLSTVRKLITHNYLHCFTYFYVFSYLCIEILHSFFIHHGYFNSGTAVQLLLLPTAFDKTPRGPPRGILNIPTTGKQLWCSKCGPKSEVQTTISQFLHLSNTTDFASSEAPGANSAHKHYASRIKSTKVIDFTSAGLELYTSHLEFASRSLHLQHTTNHCSGIPPMLPWQSKQNPPERYVCHLLERVASPHAHHSSIFRLWPNPKNLSKSAEFQPTSCCTKQPFEQSAEHQQPPGISDCSHPLQWM